MSVFDRELSGALSRLRVVPALGGAWAWDWDRGGDYGGPPLGIFPCGLLRARRRSS